MNAAAHTSLEPRELSFPENVHLRRSMRVWTDKAGYLSAMIFHGDRSLAYAGAELHGCHLRRNDGRKYSLWLNFSAFDVTETEAMQLQQVFGLRVQES